MRNFDVGKQKYLEHTPNNRRFIYLFIFAV